MEKFKLEKWQKIFLSSIILCITYFILLSVYWNQWFFVTDEGDIFFIGKTMAKGQILYKERFAHHMSVPYFISAFFYLLGAKSFITQRLCFYFLMAVLWTFMFFRYSTEFGKKTLFLYPIIYVISLINISGGHTILGEQFQAIGMVTLLMELLIFQKTRTLQIKNCIAISIAILISFGSTFVSAFSIFFIFLTFFIEEVIRIAKATHKFSSTILELFKSYWKLIVAVALPWAIMFLYFIFTGSLKDFFRCAYKMNVTVYSKYNGGYGTNVFNSMFKGGIQNILNTIYSITSEKFSLHFALLLIGGIFFFVYIQKQYKNIVLTIGLFLFLQGCAARGCFGFHGLQFAAVLCFMLAYDFEHLIPIQTKKSMFFQGMAIFVFLTISVPYLRLIPNLKKFTLKEQKSDNAKIIDLLTEENEYFGNSTFDWWLDFQIHALDAPVVGACCPWFWEWGGKKAMEWLYENRPRVYYYDVNCATWGYKITDYAPELKQFLDENYSSMDSLGYPCVYVRNDYFEDARSVLFENVPNCILIDISDNYDTMKIQVHTDKDYERVQFPTWSDENGQDDLQWYEAIPCGDKVWTYTVDLKNHNSIGKYIIHIYGYVGDKSEFVVGKEINIDSFAQ